MSDYEIFIPFLNFYKDKVDFVYKDNRHITGEIDNAFYTTSIEIAKKSFNANLKTLCPKKIWKDYGLLVLTKQQLNSLNFSYLVDDFNFKYIPINQFKHFKKIKI